MTEFAINQEVPQIPVVKSGEPVNEEPSSDVIEPGQDIKTEQVEYGTLVKDTMDDYCEMALKHQNLPTTDENKGKMLLALANFVKEQITKANFDFNVDIGKVAEEQLNDAVARRGLENNSKNLKKVIQLLLEE